MEFARAMSGTVYCDKLAVQLNEMMNTLASSLPSPVKLVVLGEKSSPSERYAKNLVEDARKARIETECHWYPDSQEVLDAVDELNGDPEVHAILPLVPSGQNNYGLASLINPNQDPDCLSFYNRGKINIPGEMEPPTPRAAIDVLLWQQAKLEGADAVVIGANGKTGSAVNRLLMKYGATSTSCDLYTPRERLVDHMQTSSIIASFVGNPDKFRITADMVPEGAIVINGGLGETADGKLKGDVCVKEVSEKALCTDSGVSGRGVGTVTRQRILFNAVSLAAELQGKKEMALEIRKYGVPLIIHA